MIKFSKYHGCGNDFIIVNEEDTVKFGRDFPKMVVKMCARNTGIGADGVLVARRSPLEMVVFNSDGSRASMCGNGIRCFANYCYDDDIIPVKVREYDIKTDAGQMNIAVKSADPFIAQVNMGMPEFSPSKVGCDCESEELVNRKINIDGEEIIISSVFMGTVHTIVWMNESPWTPDPKNGFLINEKALRLGRLISENNIFKNKTNVNFVKKVSPKIVEIITYERGVGFTAACGTGACASVVMGALERKLNKSAVARLPYGEIEVSLQKTGVMMTGPAERIAQGKYDGNKL